MTAENEQTIVRPQAVPTGTSTIPDFDPEATLDAQTIARSDLGQTIKQAVTAAPASDIELLEDEEQTIHRPSGHVPSGDPEPTDDSNVTLVRPLPSSSPMDSDATIDAPAPSAPSQSAADSEEGATIAQSPLHSSGHTAANTEAFKDTVFTGTQPTLPTADQLSAGSGTRPERTAGQSGSQYASQSGRSQSLAGTGRSHSVSLRIGESSVSINIHPRNIAKSVGGSHLKYEGGTSTEAGLASDFELLEQLGEGGMGVVYAARQSSIDRPIALKMMKGAQANANARAKFLQEAVVTGDLDHPNIVTVHDLGADSAGNVFYAMKKISGTEWSKAIKEKSRQENLDILLKVCDAVAFAHSRGVIHRDLKPENTMLGSFGEVLVMDWGLAVAVNERGKAERISSTTGISGTPAYLAPEMAAPGRWRELGFCSDIYLLGAILFEILTGHRPHTGKNVGECLRNAARNVLRETSVTGELMEIARKAMADKPADRYATVQEFQAAIREYLAHSESILLEQKAREDLAQAQQTRQHEDYAKALFGFRQAYEIWSDNKQALRGLIETVRQYASAAMQNGDLDLALSLVSRDDFAECAALKEQIRQAIRQRDEQRRRSRLLRAGVISLSAVVVLVSVVAALWINSARQEANQQRDKAELALQAEKEARAKEEKERQLKQQAQAEAKESKEDIRKRDELTANNWWQFTAEAAPQKQRQAAQTLKLPAKREFMLTKEVKLPLVLIPAGEFAMGSTTTETGRLSEENLHRVKISQPFYLAQYELTRQQFTAMGGKITEQAGDPDKGKGADSGQLPVAGLSWDDINRQILPALNKIAPAGWYFALPTEAQWEWACRAGSNTEYNTGNGETALRKAGFSGAENLTGAAPVGKRSPNAWGLYDMHGNLAEWCSDYYRKDFYFNGQNEATDPLAAKGQFDKRVVRGGSWTNLDQHCRSAYRSYANPDSHYPFIGVRVALVQGTVAPAVPATPSSPPSPQPDATAAGAGKAAPESK